MPKKGREYTVQLTIRLTKKEYEALDKIRAYSGVPISTMIREQIPFFELYYAKDAPKLDDK